MLQPMGEMILVEPFDMEKETQSGLFVVSDREPVKRGVVLAVGNGEVSKLTGKRVELDVEVGDIVLFNNYSGNEITWDGDEFRLIREAEILAKELA